VKTRVVHCKKEPHHVYIGRPSPWGNPFSHKPGTSAEFKVSSREEAIDRFREWIKTQPSLLARLPELRGKTLGCWCAPKACHGDVLAEMADALPEGGDGRGGDDYYDVIGIEPPE
jgi:hypothetical protein